MFNILYDIDGTITKEGIDLWFEVFSSIYEDNDLFDKELLEWKCSSLDSREEASYKMMKFVISKTTLGEVSKKTKEIISNIMNKDLIRKDAILNIKNQQKKGHNIIFSTTNVNEIATEFIRQLINRFDLDKDSIHIKGTCVDWESKNIKSFNIGKEKVKGIKGCILESYGDDPFVGDADLLRSAKKSFIITNNKNKEYKIDSLAQEKIIWR